MVLEKVSLVWKGLSIHCPEYLISLEGNIEILSPGWAVAARSDTDVRLKNKKLDAAIVSDYDGLAAAIQGEYGQNFEALRSVGATIKKVGGFYNMSGIGTRLVTKDCDFRLVCTEMPPNYKVLPQFDYDVKDVRFVEKTKKSKPLVTEKDGMAMINWVSTYDKILTEYRHSMPRIFLYGSSLNP